MKCPICLHTVPRAAEIPTDFVSGAPEDLDEVQEWIEYLFGLANVSASPGFTWGRSGNVPSGTYLLNDSVPSNTTGRVVPISSGAIEQGFASAEIVTTAVIAIERRVGAVFTEIATIEFAGTRVVTKTLSVDVNLGDELAVRIKSGAAKNPVIGLIIKGEV